MEPVKNADIKKFLLNGGTNKMNHIVEMSTKDKDAKRFEHHFKEVQKIVCDESVYSAINGIAHKAKKMVMHKAKRMEGMKNMKSSKAGMGEARRMEGMNNI